jgi:hypothetical protein
MADNQYWPPEPSSLLYSIMEMTDLKKIDGLWEKAS